MPKFKVGDVVRLKPNEKKSKGFVVNPLLVAEIGHNSSYFMATAIDGSAPKEYADAINIDGRVGLVTRAFQLDKFLTAARKIAAKDRNSG